jgi:hypothetical protein
MKKVKLTKVKSGKKENLKGVKTVLNKILTFLNRSYDNEVKLREKESNFKEEHKLEDDRRHKELLKVLAGISSGSGSGEGAKQKKKINSLKILDKNLEILS